MVSFDFKIKIESKEKARVLVNELAVMEGIFNVRINFKDDYEKFNLIYLVAILICVLLLYSLFF